jgi:hypothetical protein
MRIRPISPRDLIGRTIASAGTLSTHPTITLDNGRRVTFAAKAGHDIELEATLSELAAGGLHNPSVLAALNQCASVLQLVYDSSEDNKHNPVMQEIGRTMNAAQRTLRAARRNRYLRRTFPARRSHDEAHEQFHPDHIQPLHLHFGEAVIR